MKRATTINELANVLIPNRFPNRQEDENIYVPVYGKLLARLRDRVLNTELETQTLFVTGQTGTGKSTALNFLPDEEVLERFHVVHVNMDKLVDPDDIDIIDVLLMLGFQLSEESEELREKYFGRLDRLQKIHDGILEEESTTAEGRSGSAGASAEAGAKASFFSFLSLGTKLFANYKLDHDYRRKTREIFRVKKSDLLGTINDLIEDWYTDHSHGRKLLMIVDGMEKIREKTLLDDIFYKSRNYLIDLNCRKIVAIPIPCARDAEITAVCSPIEHFILRLKPNPLGGVDDPERVEKNKGLLREIVRRRIEDGCLEKLIDAEAVEEAMRMSGGHIRQFIHILHEAAVRVRRLKGERVSVEDVTKAWQTLKTSMSGAIISGNIIALLDEIRRTNVPTAADTAEFIGAVQGNQILAYINGEPWFEVNPLIEETVRVYAERQHSSD